MTASHSFLPLLPAPLLLALSACSSEARSGAPTEKAHSEEVAAAHSQATPDAAPSAPLAPTELAPPATATQQPAAHAAQTAEPVHAPASVPEVEHVPLPAAGTAPARPTKLEPSRAKADAMSVSELIARRDLWPTRVAFTQLARLDETTWWKAGDELSLHAWDEVNVGLDEGTFLFEWPADHTDVVERARALAASLTPEALSLTVDSLRERPELWPERLALTASLQFGNNTVVPAGREVSLRFFEGNDLAVWDSEVANYYTLAANETDLMARARERLLLPEKERVPFFVRSLAATLDPAAGKAALADADYVLVYFGRLGCPRCSAFVPHLKDFVRASKESAPAGSRFELVFLACDADAASAREYWSKADLPGGMIRFESRLAAANLMALPLETLPGLFVFDRKGELLDRNHPNAGSPSADDVLARFEARIAAAH
jgi:hypothetical protein